MESLSIREKENVEEELQQEIFNRIFLDRRHIFEEYSINNLKRILKYTNYNINQIYNLLDNFTKEEVFKQIETNYLIIQTQNKLQNLELTNQRTSIKPHVINKQFQKPKSIELKFKTDQNAFSKDVFEFINKGINLIDLSDAIKTIDKVKIITKLKKTKAFNNRNNKNKETIDMNFNKELIKTIEQKERKYIQLYQQSFEDSDITYLNKTIYSYFINKNKTQTNHKTQYTNFHFIERLLSLPIYVANFVLSYLNIFTIGKLGLCSKALHTMVYENYTFDSSSAKIYTSALFLNSKLYHFNLKEISLMYKTNFNMLKTKKRIRFGGVYYSKVKYIKEVRLFGEEYDKNVIIQYFRIIRFLPSGDVYMMTVPSFKLSKIKQGIKNNTIIIKRGKFKILDEESFQVIIENKDEYIYKFGWNDIKRYRLGYTKGEKGILLGFELMKYYTNRKTKEGEVIKEEIEINDKFPSMFRFRHIEHLNQEIAISHFETPD